MLDRLAGVLGILAVLPGFAAGQTDYFNTDAGRPVRIEDAYSTERYAFELKLAPVRLERARGGVYNWGIEPEIAYGVLPRTHIEFGLPFAVIDAGGDAGESGIAGLELSAFHNLNMETRTLPALGLRADVQLPVGSLGPDRTYASLTGIVTRSWRIARLHLNGRYTFGEAAAPSSGNGSPGQGQGAVETSRWLAGAAIDRAFPLSALLLTADVFARQPIHEDEDIEWNAGLGLRYQLSPRLALDAGIGRRLDAAVWSVTFGTAYVFAVRALIPRSGR